MSTVKINQLLKRVEIKSFEIENDIVFSYFDKLSAKDRDEAFMKAVYIGVLALMEDRLSSFLAKTTNELGTELESLKMIFDMKKELFFKSSIKGILAESEIAEFLQEYLNSRNIKDNIYLTGNLVGSLPKNKTGDIVCEIAEKEDVKIVIECKFDKNIRLGDIASQDLITRRSDTAWGQLLESQANRGAQIGIIVFDKSLVDNSILKYTENVSYIHDVGIIAIIDSQKGDYSNLSIAYMLARDIAVNQKQVDWDKGILELLVNRILKDALDVLSIKQLIENNIHNNKTILKTLEKNVLSVELSYTYLVKFLQDGKLTKEDLLDFYQRDSIRGKYKSICDSIDLDL
ncbi:hypothetical protein [uncultured Alistipes sp.]|jgi:hypothetical protein|uniref:hypothetical protein n=1 Tax=uncultured Alistipes sp. TaxID=538949 RepID=UPI0025F0B585|nr:hypothetical protein [uncultured Alistipes sp.]